MLTSTSETAIRALVYLAQTRPASPISPEVIASHVNASSSYMSKVTNLLVKARLLSAYRGARGGVILNRPPHEITLLDIIHACQGDPLIDYRRVADAPGPVCVFHEAMFEVRNAMTDALSRWTLADLSERACSGSHLNNHMPCRMARRSKQRASRPAGA